MTTVIGHAPDKYITGSRLASSGSLDWGDILVETWEHAPGRLNDTLPRSTEVIVMLEGNIHVRRRGDGLAQEHDAAPGAIWLCPAGVQEDRIRVSGSAFRAVHVFLPCEPFEQFGQDTFDVDHGGAALRYDGGFRDPLIEGVGRTLATELAAGTVHQQLLVDGLRTALCAYLLDRHGTRQLRPSVNPKGGLDQRRLQRVRDYVIAHLAEPIRLEQLATEACLSAYHFSRAFKASTGLTPHAYVVQQRVAHARQLLDDPQLPLECVALASGLGSARNMARTFSRELGTTPHALRTLASRERIRSVPVSAMIPG